MCRGYRWLVCLRPTEKHMLNGVFLMMHHTERDVNRVASRQTMYSSITLQSLYLG